MDVYTTTISDCLCQIKLRSAAWALGGCRDMAAAPCALARDASTLDVAGHGADVSMTRRKPDLRFF